MKIMIRLLAVGATVSVLAISTWANSLSTSYQDQCTQENKDAWYATFTQNYKGDQQKAYDAAKKYLGCVPEETDQTKYLKKFVAAWDKAQRKTKFAQLLNEKKYPEAYGLGKEILVDEPENLSIILILGASGYLAKDPAVQGDSINYAKKAIEMLGAGKTVDDWQPFKGQAEALAYLNYNIGALTLAKDPSAALPYLIKAAQAASDLKKEPAVYAAIAGAYETGPYAKQSEAYKQVYQGKDETPESKLALANINQIVDRMIDGYARAVAAAGGDAKYAAQKTEWTASLTDWYKYRNKDTTGMNEMVAGILAKPLPGEPTPITTLPASTPAATPATNSGNGATTGTTAATTTTKPATPNNTPTTNKPAAPATGAPTKPAGTTGPGKPGRNQFRN